MFREGQNEICWVWQQLVSALHFGQGRGEIHVFLSPLGYRIPCLFLARRLHPSARMPLAVPGYIEPLSMHMGILVRVMATPSSFSTCYKDVDGVGIRSRAAVVPGG